MKIARDVPRREVGPLHPEEQYGELRDALRACGRMKSGVRLPEGIPRVGKEAVASEAAPRERPSAPRGSSSLCSGT